VKERGGTKSIFVEQGSRKRPSTTTRSVALIPKITRPPIDQADAVVRLLDSFSAPSIATTSRS